MMGEGRPVRSGLMSSSAWTTSSTTVGGGGDAAQAVSRPANAGDKTNKTLRDVTVTTAFERLTEILPPTFYRVCEVLLNGPGRVLRI
jgi:hypothetical protein